jgi:hypothetical protein
MVLTITALCGGLFAEDERDREQLQKQFEEKGKASQPLLAELRTKAGNSADPLTVWHDATKIDNPFVKNEAIRQMSICLDPRSIPILEELSRQSAPKPPYRSDDGVFHYPSYAARVAARLRSKTTFEEELQRAPVDKRVEFASNTIRESKDQYVEEFALTWLLQQPASDEVINGILLRPEYARVCNYLSTVDGKFLPILCDRLEKTDDGDVARGLATVFSKRHDTRCLSSLLKSITREFKAGNNLAGVAIARTIGGFGDEVLLATEEVWNSTGSASVKKRLVVVAVTCGSKSASALLEKWRDAIRTELLELQARGGTETAVFKTKQELATHLRLFLDDLREKGVQP